MPLCEKKVPIVLGPNEYVILVDLAVNGKELGQVPLRYEVPEDLEGDALHEFVLGRVAEISKMLRVQGERLVTELDRLGAGGHFELRLDDHDDLTWVGKVPDDARELTA